MYYNNFSDLYAAKFHRMRYDEFIYMLKDYTTSFKIFIYRF